MLKEVFKLSCTGWNLFLSGSRKQRFIAYVAIGAINGGTKAYIESVTGLRKRRREEYMREQEEMYSKLEKLNVDIQSDLKKSVEKSIEETTSDRIDNLGKMLDDAKKNDPPKTEDLERITQELIQVYREDGLWSSFFLK